MYQDEMDKFATLVELMQQLIDQNEYNRKMCLSLSTLAKEVKVRSLVCSCDWHSRRVGGG